MGRFKITKKQCKLRKGKKAHLFYPNLDIYVSRVIEVLLNAKHLTKSINLCSGANKVNTHDP